jgi:C4-dicarboxylate-specific signal transduction histidine kinase
MHSDLTPEQRHWMLNEAEQELSRVTEITKQTLRFYREPSQPGPTEVGPVLDSVLKLYRSRIASADVRVNRELLSSFATVLSSPGELRQILANLIGNAIDAMRGGGCLRIRISDFAKADEESRSVRITVADNGTGIASSVLPTIFEPFVTTKGETGTGLGLWVTSEIIKKNGWKIRVRTSRSPNRSGTAFSIIIPQIAVPQPA